MSIFQEKLTQGELDYHTEWENIFTSPKFPGDARVVGGLFTNEKKEKTKENDQIRDLKSEQNIFYMPTFSSQADKREDLKNRLEFLFEEDNSDTGQ